MTPQSTQNPLLVQNPLVLHLQIVQWMTREDGTPISFSKAQILENKSEISSE